MWVLGSQYSQTDSLLDHVPLLGQIYRWFFFLNRKGYSKITDSTENAVGFKFSFLHTKAKSGQVDMTKIIFKAERFI